MGVLAAGADDWVGAAGVSLPIAEGSAGGIAEVGETRPAPEAR
ncbi:hypothetical protein DAVIS_02106 [Mycobacterium marinum]|uniref:Uncharacterized protein n=1 Tax=Mycobacterium marinum TaxID=1781 RepID=A0A3E2MXI6_MYCMR|nr:hypothetical protein DAVIS_02106 [Mycobacterium marinum]